MIVETVLASKATDRFLSALLFLVPPWERTVGTVGDPVMALSLRDTTLKGGFDDHKHHSHYCGGGAVGETVQRGPEKPAFLTCLINHSGTFFFFFFKPLFSGPNT